MVLTATANDKDGDQASARLNIGQNLVFKDDGPTIHVTGSAPTDKVDETTLNSGDTHNFSGAFTATFGADGPASPASVTAGWCWRHSHLDPDNLRTPKQPAALQPNCGPAIEGPRFHNNLALPGRSPNRDSCLFQATLPQPSGLNLWSDCQP